MMILRREASMAAVGRSRGSKDSPLSIACLYFPI